jgi:hypothetical protein
MAAAKTYLDVPKEQSGLLGPEPDRAAVKTALMQMDAAVLRLYDLPAEYESAIIALFQGRERKGVGCTFTGYPAGWSSHESHARPTKGIAESSIWDKFDEAIGSLPTDAIAALPVDGAAEHDLYLYGAPKNAR